MQNVLIVCLTLLAGGLAGAEPAARPAAEWLHTIRAESETRPTRSGALGEHALPRP